MMRHLILAVFICIAVLAIVRSDSGTAQDYFPRTWNSLNGKGAVVGDGGSSEYDFRRARWGDSKEKVKSSEDGIPIVDIDNALANGLKYKSAMESIPVEIIYGFDDNNRLREAGYFSVKLPIGDVRLLMKYARKLHGEPTHPSIDEGNMTWITNRSLIVLVSTPEDANDLYRDVGWAYVSKSVLGSSSTQDPHRTRVDDPNIKHFNAATLAYFNKVLRTGKIAVLTDRVPYCKFGYYDAKLRDLHYSDADILKLVEKAWDSWEPRTSDVAPQKKWKQVASQKQKMFDYLLNSKERRARLVRDVKITPLHDVKITPLQRGLKDGYRHKNCKYCGTAQATE